MEVKNKTKEMKVEFLISTYNRNNLLRCMLASLVAQSDGDWIAHVVIDNPDSLVEQSMKESIDDDRIKYTRLEERYNDWGHTPHQLYKQKCTADYIVMTNDDNYYVPTFVKELKLAAKDSPGIVYWDMVHSHYNYQYFKCTPVINCIDIGAFATRTDLAKEVVLGTMYDADGHFIRDFRKKFPSVKLVKIDKILFVHN